MKLSVAALCLVTIFSGCVGVNRSSLSEFSYKPYKSNESRKKHIREEKGAPDEIIQVSESSEKWVYQSGTHFEGVVLWLVVPIPFVFPSGLHSEEYLFKGEQLLTISKRDHSSEGLVYGCYPSGVHGVVFVDCGKVPFK
ncbi:hypothetical protein [Microbulbifer hydrolyticus]|uniref:Lipoprotein n=1 Tax=Microbulbifer hydrolyticus TaxID=48074 RepID=A0A6P1TAJ9_9GAMM|nr:hypothetical protein [Microbulbifer hydrolyticus]MBB5210895.1 hypothetical protein [Microbulbifer hydrolyticus]QHQ38683.1 hypothetical protein GTQ55_06555 [Microbulbifer hydrolyticus]